MNQLIRSDTEHACTPEQSGPVLALSVSGEHASVALRLPDGSISLRESRVGNQHSSQMLPLIESVIDAASLDRRELAGVAFEAGPGGFTSLRIACAIAQGIAAALEIRVCPVGTLAAVACAMLGRHQQHNDAEQDVISIVVNDARMQQVYLGIYGARLDAQLGLANTIELLAPCCVSPLHAADLIGQWAHAAGTVLLGGDGLDLLEQRADSITVVRMSDARVDARAVVMLAAAQSASWIMPQAAGPQYVRDKVALDRAEQRALRASRG